MKRGQRPSRHVRRVKTKKGRKKVLINRSIKKRRKRKSYAAIEPITEEEFERLRKKGKLIFDLRGEREKLKEMVQKLSKEDIIRINPEGTLSSFAKRIGLNPNSSKDLKMAEQLLKSKGFSIKPRAVVRERVAPSVKPPKESLERIRERLEELARIKRGRERLARIRREERLEALARKEEPGEFITVAEIRKRVAELERRNRRFPKKRFPSFNIRQKKKFKERLKRKR